MYPRQDSYPLQQPASAIPSFPQIPFPAQESASAVPFFPQIPFPAQESASAVPFSPQIPFPAQESASAVPFSPQIPFPVQQAAGIVSHSPQDAFSQQNSSLLSQTYEEPHNLRAKRAIINGIISLVLSLFTLFTLAGFAGVITGTLALVNGFTGLRAAKQLPNHMGRRRAIIGIVLGSIAWFVVLLALIIRTISPSV